MAHACNARTSDPTLTRAQEGLSGAWLASRWHSSLSLLNTLDVSDVPDLTDAHLSGVSQLVKLRQLKLRGLPLIQGKSLAPALAAITGLTTLSLSDMPRVRGAAVAAACSAAVGEPVRISRTVMNETLDNNVTLLQEKN